MLYLMFIDNQLFSKITLLYFLQVTLYTLHYFLQVSEVPYIIFDRLKIKIIYSSKKHIKREQINITEKGTVFRKDFLEGLQFQKRVGFWNSKTVKSNFAITIKTDTQGMKHSHIYHYSCTKIIQTGKILSISWFLYYYVNIVYQKVISCL